MGFFTLDLLLFLNSINYTGMLKWFNSWNTASIHRKIKLEFVYVI